MKGEGTWNREQGGFLATEYSHVTGFHIHTWKGESKASSWGRMKFIAFSVNAKKGSPMKKIGLFLVLILASAPAVATAEDCSTDWQKHLEWCASDPRGQ